MSGPKAVRYVCHEELLAVCRSLLERYKSMSVSWLRRIERGSLGEDSDGRLVEKIVKDLERMLAMGNTRDFQKRMLEETEWLEREFERRVDARAQRVRQEEQSARRRVSAVSTVLAAAAKKPGTVPQNILKVLERAKNGLETGHAAINSAVSAAFDALTPKQDKGLTVAQRELAERLGIDEKRATIRDWLTESAPADEASGSKLDVTIAQLAVRFGDAAAAPYRESAEVMALEADPHRRKLLMDSLTIKMAKFVRDEKARERLIEEADAVLAGLRSDEALFKDAIEALEAAIQNATGAALSQAIAAARSEQNRRISESGLAHRRKALLDALARLGYEVEEGMETAFAKDGRVVIEQTKRPGYGVELSGLLVNDKLQVRAMRFADNEAKGLSDIEHETEWCSTFSDLRAVLGEAGDEIVIEKALGVGERPLKVVERQVRRRAERRVQRTAD